MTVIKWAMVYGVMHGDKYRTLLDAIQSACAASDYGSEALDHIEVAEQGVSKTYTWGSPEVERVRDARWAAEEAELKEREGRYGWDG